MVLGLVGQAKVGTLDACEICVGNVTTWSRFLSAGRGCKGGWRWLNTSGIHISDLLAAHDGRVVFIARWSIGYDEVGFAENGWPCDGSWFFASALGDFAAGLIARATGGGKVDGTAEVAKAYSTTAVTSIYSTVGWTAVGVGVFLLAVSPLISKLMHIDMLGKAGEAEGASELGEPQAAGI